MELKKHQKRTLDGIRTYLELLSTWRKKAEENPEIEIDFPARA
jgi:hypothetical protein